MGVSASEKICGNYRSTIHCGNVLEIFQSHATNLALIREQSKLTIKFKINNISNKNKKKCPYLTVAINIIHENNLFVKEFNVLKLSHPLKSVPQM